MSLLVIFFLLGSALQNWDAAILFSLIMHGFRVPAVDGRKPGASPASGGLCSRLLYVTPWVSPDMSLRIHPKLWLRLRRAVSLSLRGN